MNYKVGTIFKFMKMYIKYILEGLWFYVIIPVEPMHFPDVFRGALAFLIDHSNHPSKIKSRKVDPQEVLLPNKVQWIQGKRKCAQQ